MTEFLSYISDICCFENGGNCHQHIKTVANRLQHISSLTSVTNIYVALAVRILRNLTVASILQYIRKSGSQTMLEWPNSNIPKINKTVNLTFSQNSAQIISPVSFTKVIYLSHSSDGEINKTFMLI